MIQPTNHSIMKSTLLLAAVCSFTMMQAQEPIFEPSMGITTIGIVDSPALEGVENIIDGDFNTKFLDFALDDGMGFTVDLGGIYAIPTAIEVVTANDFPVRDPMNWELLGSNDGSVFVVIDSGVISCIADRFFSRIFEFDNGIGFQWLQVNLTNACDPSGGSGIASMQLAEVQVYGSILGLNDNILSSQFSIYPNPTEQQITIDYNGNEPLINASIYDILGKKMMTLDVSAFNQSQSYQLADLSSGVYFVRLETQTATTVKRILKK